MQNGLKTYVFNERKKNFGSKGKILSIFYEKFLTDTFAKMLQNIFAYFSVSEHSAPFLFFRKNTYFGYGQGFPTPPPLYGLVNNL